MKIILLLFNRINVKNKYIAQHGLLFDLIQY